MQKIYDLIYQLSRGIKSRFGYAFTIKQAILAAYFAFLLGVFVELTGFVHGAYLTLQSSFPTAGGAVVHIFPSATIVSTGTTAYIGILIFKKATSYVDKAWQAWRDATHM
jgi:hypothetical protein